MRRPHSLTLHELAPPADSIALILGAEAERGRRHASSWPASPGVRSPEKGIQLPSDAVSSKPAGVLTSSDAATGENEPGAGFLGREDSYSRLHTKKQTTSESRGAAALGPSYSKTMHAFTLNQLTHSLRSSRSAASSPRLGAKFTSHLPPLPTRLDTRELEALSRDEGPYGPVNTPDGHDHHHARRGLGRAWRRSSVGDVQGIDFRKLKRSWTEPPVVRNSAVG